MNELNIYGFTTGRLRVKTRFLNSVGTSFLSSMLGALTDPNFSPLLPVWCWVIDHPQGLVVIDTGLTEHGGGDTAFSRTQIRLAFQSGDELAAQMRSAGLDPAAVSTLIFTHLHVDHDRGAGDFPNARLLVSAQELAQYTGRSAAMLGYAKPTWKRQPDTVEFSGPAVGTFPHSHDVLGDGRIILVPTPGHTKGHLSVLVRQPEADVVLAGDLSYTQTALMEGTLGGFLMHPAAHRESMARVRDYARHRPTIYLPSHDPQALTRLQTRQPLIL